MLKDNWAQNLSFSKCVSWSDKALSFFTKEDVLPTGTNSIIEHGEQINVGIAVLTEG